MRQMVDSVPEVGILVIGSGSATLLPKREGLWPERGSRTLVGTVPSLARWQWAHRYPIYGNQTMGIISLYKLYLTPPSVVIITFLNIVPHYVAQLGLPGVGITGLYHHACSMFLNEKLYIYI